MAMKDKKYDRFAIASFVLSLVIFFTLFWAWSVNEGLLFFGLFIFSLPVCIIIFIFGITALRRIKENKNLKGNILAILGIVFSIIMLLFYIFMIIRAQLDRRGFI